MLIIWGKKRVETPLGQVADFCPICREIRAFEIFRTGLAGHIYGVKLGDGKLLGHVKQCKSCGLRLGADPQQYERFEEKSTTDLEVLIIRTFPAVRKQFAERLALEEQIRRKSGPLPPETRQKFIMEPFVLYNGVVEAWFAGNVPLDARSGLGCLGTIVVSVTLLFIAGAVQAEAAKDRLFLAVLAVFAIGTVWTLLQFYLRPHHRVRRKILPYLALALKPLGPTRDELADCLDKCVRMRMKIGQAIKLEQIRAEIEQPKTS
jgi:hypothetical protein